MANDGSSRDEEDGRDDRDDRGEGDDALWVARREARATLDHQLATLDDMDRKAISILRLDVTIASVLVTVLSLVTGIRPEMDTFVNEYVGVSVAFLVISAVAAALTYTVSAQIVGIDAAALEDVPELADEAFYQRLVASYADWIRFNRTANVRKAPLLTSALLGLIAGIVFLALGGLAALATVTLPVQIAAGVVLVVAVFFSGLYRQLQRVGSAGGAVTVEKAEIRGFDGERTFKGDDKQR
jgi:hypothetical protein